MREFEVVNIVGMVTFQQELDLAALANTFSDRKEITRVKFNELENQWLQTRFAPNDTYVAFYRSGRCSIVGCKSADHFESVAERVNTVMRDLLEYDYDPVVKISNIVVTTDLGSTIPLEILFMELGMERSEYEPEQFPGLMYRGSNFVVIVFSSGKLLCTGLDDLDDISDAINEISEKIQLII